MFETNVGKQTDLLNAHIETILSIWRTFQTSSELGIQLCCYDSQAQ